MSPSAFDVRYPFRWGPGEDIRVTLRHGELAGSPRHVLRFDFYPFIAPSHPDRHLAYVDLPLAPVSGVELRVAVRDGMLSVRDAQNTHRLPPVWKGALPLSGYLRVTISLEAMEGAGRRKVESTISPPLWLITGEPSALEWIQLSVTQCCNLACPMCSLQCGADLERRHIADDVLSALLDAAPAVQYIGLQGLGEPLLNPRFPAVVSAFRRRLPAHGRLAVTTNGTLLTRDLAARVFDAGLNTVTFSIDGASKAIYERHRTGACFEALCANIKTATMLARATGREDLWLGANMTMGPGNLAEVPDFVQLGARLGLSKVCFFRGRRYPSMRIVELDAATLSRVTDEALALGRRLGIAVLFAKPRSGHLPECPFMSCAYLWLTGEVAPCHRMEPPGRPWPTQLFGNVRKRPLLEIWSDPQFVAFRRSVMDGPLPAACRDCTFTDGVICGG
jgi:MoaA/NifB/PqqE/SkfB family radical SAM enzyme